MDFYDFPGARRQLTWVRTPLHERDLELTEIEKAASDGEADYTTEKNGKIVNGDPGASHSSPKSPIQTLKVFFRRRARSFPGNGKNAHRPGRAKPPGKKRERTLWNMLHINAGGQSFRCPEWIFQGHPKTLLGNVERRQLFYHQKQQCYLFPEVLPDVFNAVSSLEIFCADASKKARKF